VVRLRRPLSALDYPNIFQVDAGDPTPQNLDRRSASLLLLQLQTIRMFERWLLDNEQLVHGPLHSSIGEEAVAVGACAALVKADTITSTHRAHHHVLAKTMAFYTPDHFNPLVDPAVPEPLEMCVTRTLAEIMGLARGWQGGRGGSMHLCDPVSGVIGTTAIVGGGIPITAGAALAERMRSTGNVALAFFGDGAASIGAFHEGISMARAWNLPAIFLVENNQYSVATTVRETMGFDDVVIRAAGQDMLGLLVDGMDVLAVWRAVELAREHAIAGNGPVLIEAKTYRYFHQVGKLPGSAYGYRSKSEEGEWTKRDPVDQFAARLLAESMCQPNELDAIAELSRTLVDRAAEACTSVVDGVRTIPSDRWPDPADAIRGVRSDGHEFVGKATAAPDRETVTEETTFGNAISTAIHRAMARDPTVFVLGEDVGHLRGGTYGSTKKALEVFPDRILSTPIAELGFCGVALGAALRGMRPIVEIMFPDFSLVAADQLFNHIANARYMYGGDTPVPIVVRTRTGQGRGYGPQHSSDPAGVFGLFPGWRIIAPSTPWDYVGLFNTAIHSEDPVLVIEHHRLWPTRGAIPVSELDYLIPFGEAALRRKGRDVTVLAWSEPVSRALAIAEDLNRDRVDVEVLDLRSIDRAGLDMAAIGESLRKTGKLVIVEDAARSYSIGSQIADRIYAELGSHISQPIVRVTGKDIPSPVSSVLEQEVILSDADIRSALMGAVNRATRS
jgi:2-oxoisovalerate dehydrogenase E1 component